MPPKIILIKHYQVRARFKTIINLCYKNCFSELCGALNLLRWITSKRIEVCRPLHLVWKEASARPGHPHAASQDVCLSLTTQKSGTNENHRPRPSSRSHPPAAFETKISYEVPSVPCSSCGGGSVSLQMAVWERRREQSCLLETDPGWASAFCSNYCNIPRIAGADKLLFLLFFFSFFTFTIFAFFNLFIFGF